MRTKPYTATGISRVPCAKCGRPSQYQWQVCADGNQYRGVCADHDIELNAMVMRWFWGDSREDDIAAYEIKARQ